MKRIIYPLAFVTVIALSAFTLFNFHSSSTWQLDEGYQIKFTSEDPTGIFSSLQGDIIFNENDLENSSFDMKVSVSSINTGNGVQNQHARSSDWLDAHKYPYITFKSNTIEKDGEHFKTTGDLFIHGVTREFTMPFQWKKTGNGGVFTSAFEVNRNDFNIGKPGSKASEVLRLDLSVPVKK